MSQLSIDYSIAPKNVCECGKSAIFDDEGGSSSLENSHHDLIPKSPQHLTQKLVDTTPSVGAFSHAMTVIPTNKLSRLSAASSSQPMPFITFSPAGVATTSTSKTPISPSLLSCETSGMLVRLNPRVNCDSCSRCLDVCGDDECGRCAMKLHKFFNSNHGRGFGLTGGRGSRKKREARIRRKFEGGDTEVDHVTSSSSQGFLANEPNKSLAESDTQVSTPNISDDDCSSSSSSSSSASSWETPGQSPLSTKGFNDPSTPPPNNLPLSLVQSYRIRARNKTSYTLCETSSHNKLNDCWIIAGKNVYDATDFLNRHPGGVRSILRYSGGRKDCTEDLNFHSCNARVMWEQYKIGRIVKCSGCRWNDGCEEGGRSSAGKWPMYTNEVDGKCNVM